MKYAPVLLLAALAAPTPASAGWLCNASFEAGGFHGALFRWISHDGHPDGRLWIQSATGPDNRMISWEMTDPAGYPVDRSRGPTPLTPERAFAAGPHVQITYGWVGARDGPIWAHYYGDGHYAGVELIESRLRARATLGRDAAGRLGDIRDPAIRARLASARQWTIVVADGTGRETYRETLRLPLPAEVEAGYRRAKLAVDRMTANFRADCAEDEEPVV